jgi:hypothetical protein
MTFLVSGIAVRHYIFDLDRAILSRRTGNLLCGVVLQPGKRQEVSDQAETLLAVGDRRAAARDIEGGHYAGSKSA